MKKAGVLALLVAVVLAAAGVTWWRTDGALPAQAQQEGRRQPPPAAVEAATVKVDRVTVQIDAVGTLEPAEAVRMAPEIDGILAEILFREGAQVKAGQVLVRLDDAILKAELAQPAPNSPWRRPISSAPTRCSSSAPVPSAPVTRLSPP